MLYAHLEVLPECSTREALEGGDDDHDAHFAAGGCGLQRGQQDVSVVLGPEFAGHLESHDARGKLGDLVEHGPVTSSGVGFVVRSPRRAFLPPGRAHATTGARAWISTCTAIMTTFIDA